MYKVAVLGDADSIYGFAALGLAIFPVRETEPAAELLEKLAQEDYAVIYITEELADRLKPQLAGYDGAVAPAIVPIPGAFGNSGCGVARVRHFVEQAVGSDIIFGTGSPAAPAQTS